MMVKLVTLKGRSDQDDESVKRERDGALKGHVRGKIE
jgi:hypothetical protein